MKARLRSRPDGTYGHWNYWEPAGPWDYTIAGKRKHWVGVHPNASYYVIDVDAIIAAYEHTAVFIAEDVRRLIATALAQSRLWPALVPYSEPLRRQFEASVRPAGWTGLVSGALVSGASAAPSRLTLTASRADASRRRRKQ